MVTTLGIEAVRGEIVLTRKGSLLYLPLGFPLPPICLRCAKPAHSYSKQTLTWYPEPSQLLLLVFGAVPYRSLHIGVPLCRDHLWNRRIAKLLGCLLLIAAIPWGIGVGSLTFAKAGLLGLIVCLLTFVAGGVVLWKSEILHIRHLDDSEVALSGVSEEMLSLLPERRSD